MNLGILSRAPRAYSTKRFMAAAKERGHKPQVLNTGHFSISVEEENPDLYYHQKRVRNFDAILPRVGASVTYFGTAVVRQFEQMGVFCANSALGITHSRDKLRSLQILCRHDVGIPHSAFVRDKKDVLPAIERVGGAPVIIKLLEGTQGVGVILADTIKMAEAIIQTLQSAKQNVLIQKFVAESRGRDVRALVVGEHVVAAMRRVAHGQEFRSNVHRGGAAQGIELDETYQRTAIKAAQILGLRIAGVDMLEGADGPRIVEVNSSPGLAGIEGATGVDVAGAIIEYIEDQVQLPDMDLRQRLTVSKGYGVAEIPIPKKSELLGKTIDEAGLWEKDISVLTLTRSGTVIANPRATRKIQLGDRLLCFGKLQIMKSYIPKRKRRRITRLSKTATSEARVADPDHNEQDHDV